MCVALHVHTHATFTVHPTCINNNRKAHRKCDRLYPVCSECNCRGLADKCSYQQPKKRGPKNTTTSSGSSPPPLDGQLQHQQPVNGMNVVSTNLNVISPHQHAPSSQRSSPNRSSSIPFSSSSVHQPSSGSSTFAPSPVSSRKTSPSQTYPSSTLNSQENSSTYYQQQKPPMYNQTQPSYINYMQPNNPSYQYQQDSSRKQNGQIPSSYTDQSKLGQHRYHPYASSTTIAQTTRTNTEREISPREISVAISQLKALTSVESFDIDVHYSYVLDLYFYRFILAYPLIKREDVEEVVIRRLLRKNYAPKIEEKDDYFLCTFYAICMSLFQRLGKRDIAHHFYLQANRSVSSLMLYEEDDTNENSNKVGLNFELCLNIALICIYLIGNGDLKKASIYYNIGMGFIQQVNLFGEMHRGFLIAYYGLCELMLFSGVKDQIKCFAIIVNKHLKGTLNFIQSAQFQTLESCLQVLHLLQEKQQNLMVPSNFDFPDEYSQTLEGRFELITSHFNFVRAGLEIKAYLYFGQTSTHVNERLKQLADYILSLTSMTVFEDLSVLVVEAVVMACRVILERTETIYDYQSIRMCYVALCSLDRRFAIVRKIYGDVFLAIEGRIHQYDQNNNGHVANNFAPITDSVTMSKSMTNNSITVHSNNSSNIASNINNANNSSQR
nr:unnamed protein product [Naegleria fowleri]